MVARMVPHRTRCATFQKEVQVLHLLRGRPHVLQLLDAPYVASFTDVMVTEIALFGSLCDWADHLDFECIELCELRASRLVEQVVLQTCCGLHELANLGLQHGDLRCTNVLVFSYDISRLQIHVKLADFGSVRGLSTGDDVDALAVELRKLLS